MGMIFDCNSIPAIFGCPPVSNEAHRKAVGQLALSNAIELERPMAVWKDATSSKLSWGPIEPENARWTILDVAYPEGFIAQVQV